MSGRWQGLEGLEPHGPHWATVADSLAATILTCAVNGQPHGAGRALATACTLDGPWRHRTMSSWIDTLLAQLGFTADRTPHGDPRSDAPIGLTVAQLDEVLHEVDVDDVAPLPRWAGRLITARAALDVDGQRALLQAPPTGSSPDEQLLAVLNAVAGTIRHHPDAGTDRAAS